MQDFFHNQLSAIVWTYAYSLVPLIYLLYVNSILAAVSYGLIPLIYWAVSKAMKPLAKLTNEQSAASADAIVGESGSGKSTLFEHIEGFYLPDSGRAAAFGRDIGRIDLHKLRDHIAIVPQDPFLMTGTLRDNLLLGREGADDDDLLEALRVAGLGNLRAVWPEGLNVQVAEHGANLSGGQKQRVAIARAVLRGVEVLLFDEVTSALDYETEREIVRSIHSLAATHTLVIISHRLSIVRGADRILVLENGRIAEEGTHAQLLAKGGPYAGLHRIESEGGRLDA